MSSSDGIQGVRKNWYEPVLEPFFNLVKKVKKMNNFLFYIIHFTTNSNINTITKSVILSS